MAASLTGCEPTGQAPSGDFDAGTQDTGDPPDATDDADAAPPDPPEMHTTTDHITFEGVEVGDTDSYEITIDNRGEADLTVETFELSLEDESNHQLELADDAPDIPADVTSDRMVDFPVEYTPLNPGSTTGEIRIVSDDPNNPEVTIRVETISADPELDAPDRVVFEPVDPSESDTIGELEVANRGIAPLMIEDVYVDPASNHPDAFSAQLVDFGGPADLPETLEQHAFLFLEVTFEPDADALRTAEVIIDSNDPGNPEHVVEVSGNHEQPCLSTSGDLDFGEIPLGEAETDTINLINCAQAATLTIDDVVIFDDGGGVFDLVEDFDESVSLSPLETESIEVEASMETDQDVVGTLVIESDADGAEQLYLELRARPEE